MCFTISFFEKLTYISLLQILRCQYSNSTNNMVQHDAKLIVCLNLNYNLFYYLKCIQNGISKHDLCKMTSLFICQVVHFPQNTSASAVSRQMFTGCQNVMSVMTIPATKDVSSLTKICPQLRCAHEILCPLQPGWTKFNFLSIF